MNTIKISDYESCIQYCLFILSKIDYSEKTILDKLSKRTTTDIALEVVNRLKELNYINDHRYAQTIVKNYQNKEGKIKLKNRLILKGVPKDIINEALSNVETKIDPYLLEKKFKQYDKSIEHKYWSFLASKGYNGSEISKVITIFKKAELDH